MRQFSAVAGHGLRSAQRLSGPDFLKLFDTPSISGAFEPAAADAEAAILQHFSQRSGGSWLELPQKITDLRIDLTRMSDREIIDRADAALAFELHPSGVKPKCTSGSRIDWQANPTDNKEWLLMLHRHAWWALWGAAYKLSGDEKYAQAFVAQICDWIERNPMPASKSEHHAPWRLMECGLRLRLSWIPAFGCFYHSSHFTDAAKLLVLRAIYDHCNFLQNFFTNRNHLVRESNGLVAAATSFPEFAESQAWLTEGIARLDRELQAQVNKDGSHIEMSVGYQWLAIDEFEVTRSLLRRANSSLPNVNLQTTLEAMYEFLGAVMRPDRNFPQLNDGFILWDADRLAAAARDFKREDLEYVATCGECGQVPVSTSRSFPNAGVHVMRSGWDADARYMIFDTGPYGGPHGHEDKLSFELFAFGSPFIVDPGSYTYQPDDPYRNYFVGSQGHNTIVVDGHSQIRRWDRSHLDPVADDSAHGEWLTAENFDWVCGTYDEGYAEFSLQNSNGAVPDKGISHTRQIVFAKPDYWIIVDELSSEESHQYTALFHLAPDIEVIHHADKAAVLQSRRSGAKLLMQAVCAEPIIGKMVIGQESPIQGWYSEDHHSKQPTATLMFNIADIRSTVIAWVLVPLRQQDDVSQVDISEIDARGSAQVAFGVTLAPGVSVAAGQDSIQIETQAAKNVAAAINIIRAGGRRWPTR